MLLQPNTHHIVCKTLTGPSARLVWVCRLLLCGNAIGRVPMHDAPLWHAALNEIEIAT